MAGVTLTIEPQGLDTVLQALQSLQQHAANLAPALDDIGAYFGSETAERFIEENAPDGTPWEPSQRAINDAGKTLTDHGHLRDSFTWNILDGGQTLEFGTNVIYAGIHQFGGPTGRNHSVDMPARPILTEELSADDEAEILTILTSYLNS